MESIQIEQMPLNSECLALFDYLSDVIFFIKNKKGEFLKVNTGFLQKLGFKSKDEVIGKTDYDLFNSSLAAQYSQSDKMILNGILSIYHKEEVIQEIGGMCRFVTTKFPLKNDEGEIEAVIGITRDILDTKVSNQVSSQLRKALEYIDDHLNEDIKISKLASLSNMSDSTFLRAFKKDFKMTPKRYIISRKVKRAAKMIKETETPLCDISLSCGFSDQSHMTREFKRVTGVTPSQYLDKIRSELRPALHV